MPFCTHGGGGFGETETRIAEECKSARILPGLAGTGDTTREEIVGWLCKIGLAEK